ncbi:hypothetical protein THERMOT_51 [Bathymodiolus thermophilus thioautotrophic gill symbiont]|uniref:Uncharacterized protein n=1 Tax=Bathymodiolus thermophilus thioautotrophic gill symbiont TaxID=2360 RepID=A0A8H8XEH0_9GAMM|nr:hypothetical protein THERMOT_51 [Bathymodiolus thermophilus thioautotrophic gill symbiont]CAB5498863.1 hypothetical protein THERMOS_921 [Bathymodiolus thermophilus thioautotrophic gill symbiont]
MKHIKQHFSNATQQFLVRVYPKTQQMTGHSSHFWRLV